MDHDAPEREVLNLLESYTCYKVARKLLNRRFAKTAVIMREFGKTMRTARLDSYGNRVGIIHMRLPARSPQVRTHLLVSFGFNIRRNVKK